LRFPKKLFSIAVARFESAVQDLLMVPAFWEFSNKVFPERWIGKGGPIAWPAPYSDLTL